MSTWLSLILCVVTTLSLFFCSTRLFPLSGNEINNNYFNIGDSRNYTNLSAINEYFNLTNIGYIDAIKTIKLWNSKDPIGKKEWRLVIKYPANHDHSEDVKNKNIGDFDHFLTNNEKAWNSMNCKRYKDDEKDKAASINSDERFKWGNLDQEFDKDDETEKETKDGSVRDSYGFDHQQAKKPVNDVDTEEDEEYPIINPDGQSFAWSSFFSEI